MKYQNVCIEALGYTLPETIVSSEEIEQRLEPLYQRLKLPEGRLELMTGIKERRFWPQGTMIGDISVVSCEMAMRAANWDRSRVGALVHGSVCRDYLEPATACRVHHKLELPRRCVAYDTSNACLGILNGMLQCANMIELGHIQSALIVGTENGRVLVDGTIDALNRDTSLTRKSIKQTVASLTIGSASCAVLLAHRSISQTGNALVAGVAHANTQYHDLCQSHDDQAGQDMQPLMETDSETLMHQGVETGRMTFDQFLETTNWNRDDISHTFCHQVGGTHRKLMLEASGLDEQRDYASFPYLGNTGSAALPVTMAIAAEKGKISLDSQIALLGIGSGINCIIIGSHWQQNLSLGCQTDSAQSVQAGN